jgi:hypothetical protein
MHAKPAFDVSFLAVEALPHAATVDVADSKPRRGSDAPDWLLIRRKRMKRIIVEAWRLRRRRLLRQGRTSHSSKHSQSPQAF